MLRYPSGNGHRAPHVALGDPTNNPTTTASTTDPTGSRGAGQGPTEVAGGPTCCGSRPTHNRAPPPAPGTPSSKGAGKDARKWQEADAVRRPADGGRRRGGRGL